MSFVEFVGVLIFFFTLAFVIIRSVFESYKRMEDPQKYEEQIRQKAREQEKILKEFFQELNPYESDRFKRDKIKEETHQKTPYLSKQVKEKRAPADKNEKKTLTTFSSKKPLSKISDRKLHDHEYEWKEEGVLGQLFEKAQIKGEKRRKSKGRALIDRLESRKNMVILHEIFDSPKGL